MQRIIIACLLLSGCKATDPIDTQYKALDKQIQATYNTLPAGCKTAPVLAQFEALSRQAVAVKATCESAVKLEQAKNEKLRWIIVLAIVGYLLVAALTYAREKGKWLP